MTSTSSQSKDERRVEMKYVATMAVIFATTGCGVGVSSSPEPPAASDGDVGKQSDATCSDPAGPSHPYTQKAELETLILGRWRYCSGSTLSGDPFDGFEFTADGRGYALVDDGTGKLVRATGFGSQGRWNVPPGSLGFAWSFSGGGDGGRLEFEDSPRRFRMGLTAAGRRNIVYIEAGQ
jgi:hypothetical protein